MRLGVEMRWTVCWLGMLGCTAAPVEGETSGGTTSTATTATTTAGTTPTTGTDETTPTPTDTAPLVLNGTVPPDALPVPTFSDVVNQDAQARTQADLIGHPTVMWFYPAAATVG
jgi:hypothetical protein